MSSKLYINQLGLSDTNVKREIEKETILLYNHPLYSSIKSESDIKKYLSNQVWCVWDFMTLVKSLQMKLIPPDILWTPPKHPTLGAYIYEVLLTEETDKGYDTDENSSHFQTFLAAMKEAEVNTDAIDYFIDGISNGQAFYQSINNCGINSEVRKFVETTYRFALSELHITTAVFCLSREGIIPGMFMNLLSNLSLGKKFKIFNWYLNRHIYLDSESHGPLSIKLFKTVIDNTQKENEALEAALEALRARNEFLSYIKSFINN